MNNHIVIKSSTDDFERLVDIEKRAGEKYREAGYDPSTWPTTNIDRFAEYQKAGGLWVACLDSKAVGFATLEYFGDFAHLEELDVEPEHMGQGIGSALLRKVIDHSRADKKGLISLRTFKKTPWAMNLYKKFGFEICRDESLAHLNTKIENEKSAGLPVEDRISMFLDLA